MEDRNKGDIVIEGHVDEAGRVDIDRVEESLTFREREDVVARRASTGADCPSGDLNGSSDQRRRGQQTLLGVAAPTFLKAERLGNLQATSARQSCRPISP